METAAILAIIGAISTLVTTGVSMYQQKNEFSQQQQLMQSSQDYQSEREDIAFSRNLPDVLFNNYRSLGVNPNIAADSILGNTGQIASSSGSPSAPSVNSAMGALSNLFGGNNQALQDALLKAYQMQNLESQTHKNDVEAGIMPRDYFLRQLSTEQQIKVWNASAELMSKQAGYNEQLTNLVKEQITYYGRLTDAQIDAYRAQVTQAVAAAQLSYEQLNTERHKQANIDANTAVQVATEQNVYQNTILQLEESNDAMYRADRERIARDFEAKLGGVPLSADAQKMVNKWLMDGEFDKVRQFYETIFSTSLSQEVGTTLGKPKMQIGLPFNIFRYENQNAPLRTLQNLPYFNPDLRQ